ncbi:hypothetical protein [Rhizobium sp. RU20A]|uniref:hypothetical protein n=1 Tax=Rhizobium sp. RU20A TaxID=1907412 RepID=UPI00122CCF04|nr:hypothetical protein [Rhizobium sp. RU20A]
MTTTAPQTFPSSWSGLTRPSIGDHRGCGVDPRVKHEDDGGEGHRQENDRAHPDVHAGHIENLTI